MANIAARKKLSALYARGAMIRFGPAGPRIAVAENGKFPVEDVLADEELEVWVAPPNPQQREMALRDAQAARARSLLRARKDEDSEEYLTSMAYLSDMTFETLVEYLLMADQEGRNNEAIRLTLAEKEWENIDELRDGMRQFEEAGSPDNDPEWKSLQAADKRYGDQVDVEEQRLTDAARESMAMIGRDELERRALEKRGEIVGSQAFMYEYERQMKFYAVRDADNHMMLFYDSVREFSESEEIVQTAIADALGRFIREGNEAKNSQGVVPGSDSSELPSKPETSEASTPKEPTESVKSPGTSKRPSSTP
jgi:hypothetical protein